MPASASHAKLLFCAALTGFVLGLLPQLAVYCSLGAFENIFVLLGFVYAVLFASLGLLAFGASLVYKKSGPAFLASGGRFVLLLEAAGLSGLWYYFLNPFPIGLLVQMQQYALAALVAMVLLLAWFGFVLIIKKLF